MKYFTFLDTDFYQLSMGFAYVVLEKNKEITGFEGFVRNIKKEINPIADFYIFDGEKEVKRYIEIIKEELKNPDLIEIFIKLIKPKIPKTENINKLIKTFRKNWKKIDKDFEFRVVPNGTVVFPFIPVFQFKGDKLIGQIIETYVTNIYNGRTALKTIEYLREHNQKLSITLEELNELRGIMNNDPKSLKNYKNKIKEMALEFRLSTDKILLEAAFRRSPTKYIADYASSTAIGQGWNGTSNTSLRMREKISDKSIGGTMAHAFIMSYKTEKEAFEAWNEIFPNTTMLIDTYNVGEAIKVIKDNNYLPKEVRIDSEPMQEYIDIVKKEMPEMEVFVSGDMTPQRLKELNNYDKAMAGTKYVYCNDNDLYKKLNSGFVYKIVEYTKDDKTYYPEKKSTGKASYSGLKYIEYDKEKNTIVVKQRSDIFGFSENYLNENELYEFISKIKVYFRR